MQEFDLIKRFFLPLTANDVDGDQLRDDAYFFNVQNFADHQQNLVMSMDIITQGVHFFGHESAGDIAEKALMVNISDLLGSGAKIYGYFLGLKLTHRQNEDFIRDFCQRLYDVQQQYHCHLLGGDTSVDHSDNSQLTIAIHAIGYVDHHHIIRRSTAKIGDDIWVSGDLGNSAIGCDIIKHNHQHSSKDHLFFADCYYKPCPPTILADHLKHIANSAMDISDGLIGDLKHILTASNVGAELYLNHIPYNHRADNIYNKAQIYDFMLSGGDDYQILFTADKDKSAMIKKIAQDSNIKISKIGAITNNIQQCILYDKIDKKIRNIIDYHDKSWQYNIGN